MIKKRLTFLAGYNPRCSCVQLLNVHIGYLLTTKWKRNFIVRVVIQCSPEILYKNACWLITDQVIINKRPAIQIYRWVGGGVEEGGVGWGCLYTNTYLHQRLDIDELYQTVPSSTIAIMK